MRNKDSLEKFITNNRSSFDDLKAPSGVWTRIEKKDRPVFHMWKWSAVAASALLLIAIGYILGDRANAPVQNEQWAEYQETENFYQAQVSQKLDEIKSLPVSEEVLSDIQMLDDVYEDLRRQLMDDPNADARILLTAMVKHNKQKLEVLEKIISRVNKYQKNENQNHEI
jgi:hypothetical protein